MWTVNQWRKLDIFGSSVNSQYNDDMIGVLTDIDICSRAVLIWSVDSTLSKAIDATHFLRLEHNLNPFYFYENTIHCNVWVVFNEDNIVSWILLLSDNLPKYSHSNIINALICIYVCKF